jgi:hypothetical protein
MQMHNSHNAGMLKKGVVVFPAYMSDTMKDKDLACLSCK